MRNDIKLIGFDMDGTLLGKDRVLTRRTIDTLEKVGRLGVNLVVDSGRLFPVVPEELRRLSCMRYYILSNGAEIYDKLENKTLYRAQVPLDKALLIYDALTQCDDMYIDCYMSDASWARAEEYYRIEEYVSDKSHQEVLLRTRMPVKDLRQEILKRGKPVYKLQSIYKNREIRDKEMERMRNLFPEMGITSAYTYNLEINSLDATKGRGLMKLAEILGFSREQVIAFGDGENDVSMLQCAGTGYAMENAASHIKAAADKIAPPNTEDGVAQVLEELFL